MNEILTYMGYMWASVDNDVLTLGLTDEGIDELVDVTNVDLPEEDSEVLADEVFGEVVTESGSLNLYSPADGKLIEINQAVKEDVDVLLEDPMGEGWLVKIEMKDPSQLDQIKDDDDDDDDYDDDDESDDESDDSDR